MKSTIYINKKNATVEKRGSKIIVRHESEKIQEASPLEICSIICLERVNFSSEALLFLRKHDIDISFVSASGKHRGRVEYCNLSHANTRVNQCQMDNGRRLQNACNIVKTKIINSRNTLLRWLRYKGLPPKKISNELISITEKLKFSRNHDELMGYEGSASAIYFREFCPLVKPFLFNKRESFPPPDPVNIMLSFGYTLLYNTIAKEIQNHFLDPFVGVLHSIQDRRLSLALDLMEEFRSILIDRMVLRLIGKKVIQPENFEPDPLNNTWRMKKETIGLYITEWQETLNKKWLYPPIGKKLSVRQIIVCQIEHFKRIVNQKSELYQPFEFR